MKLKNLIFPVFLFFTIQLYSQNESKIVDTISIYSDKMDKNVDNVIVLPHGYNNDTTKYPVLYLLHGYGGDHKLWIDKITPNLPDLATKYDLIIVCPNGENSWYWDSPINPNSQFETYISKELVTFIDFNYRTTPVNWGRAITGFSMGGHGALWIGIRHPDVFLNCGSMGGGVDIRPFPKSWDMSKQLGKYTENKDIWDSHTIMTEIKKVKGDSLSFIIDCGREDFFYNYNVKLHDKMTDMGIEHTFLTREGRHVFSYWRKSLPIQMEFFSNIFQKNNKIN